MIASNSACRQAMRGGDADVTHGTLALHLEQGFEVFLPGEQVVHLDQIEPLDTPQAATPSISAGPSSPEEVQTLVAANRPGGLPSRLAVTDHGLGRAVHRRRIGMPPPAGKTHATTRHAACGPTRRRRR